MLSHSPSPAVVPSPVSLFSPLRLTGVIVMRLRSRSISTCTFIYAALAEKERALISERTKASLAGPRGPARGTRLGNPRLAEAAARGVASSKAEADQFAANILPVIREIQAAGGSRVANAIASRPK